MQKLFQFFTKGYIPAKSRLELKKQKVRHESQLASMGYHKMRINKPEGSFYLWKKSFTNIDWV